MHKQTNKQINNNKKIQPGFIQVADQVGDAQRLCRLLALPVHLSASVQPEPGFAAPGRAVAALPPQHRTGGAQPRRKRTQVPRRQLGRAVASVPRRAAALKGPLARTGGSEGWAAGEGGESPGVSDGAHSAHEGVHLSPGWTRGAGAARARAGPQDNDFESSARTPAFDASLLSGCASCCGTVALCFSPERTLEVRRFRRNCKKQYGRGGEAMSFLDIFTR